MSYDVTTKTIDVPATPRPERSLAASYGLWALCFIGFAGIHRFYVGRPISGFIWLITGGLFFVGQIIDLFMMQRMVEDHRDGAKIW